MRNCLNCGKETGSKKYCNLTCEKRFRSKTGRLYQGHRKSTCERCGTTKNLHVHHKDENPSNNDASNLLTLCKRHHQIAHSAGPKVNIRIKTDTYHKLAVLREELFLKSIDQLINQLIIKQQTNGH